MSKTAKFWDKHAAGYAKRKVGNEEAYQKKLAQTQDLLTADSIVFEFGCGTGTTALHHAPHVSRVIATDVSGEMIKIAQEKAVAQGVANVTFLETSIEDYSSEKGAFDMVMAHSILHLLPDHKSAIARSYDMLKPGGIFVSSTGCLKGVMPWLRVVLPVGHFFGLLPDVKFFSTEELRQDIMVVGFDIQDAWQPSPTQGYFVIARKPA